MLYNCIIVDDDEIDRLTALSHVKKYPFLQIKGIYENAEQALAEIHQTQPQVLFLDIDMGEMSGLDLRKQLLHIDACIFITSYPDYAVDSFELAALDYLVKPINANRFTQSMVRLESYLSMCRKSDLLDHSLQGDTIFIKDGYEQIKIRSSEILYLEALKDYTQIVTASKKHCVLSTLGNLLKDAAFQSFIRVHRSFAVQKHFIEKLSAQEIRIHNTAIPVGRTYKEALQELIRQPNA